MELTAMDLFVPLQQILLNEAHVTLTAPKWPLTCMIGNTFSKFNVNKLSH